MNKIALLSCMAAALFAYNNDALAKKNLGGGFSGPGVEVDVITIEQAKGMRDDTPVVLRGKIQQKIGDELYVFSDDTGTVNIEIDDDDWMGLTVGPDDLVEITGEVDKGWTKMEIEVDQIQKVNQ